MVVRNFIVFIILLHCSGLVLSLCQLPNSLDNLTLICLIEPNWSPQNPNAGAIAQVTYSKDRYKTVFLNKNIPPFEGKYTFNLLDKSQGIGLLTGFELSPLEKPTHTVLFKCLTDNYGTAIFTQESGTNENKSRQNTVIYSIQYQPNE